MISGYLGARPIWSYQLLLPAQNNYLIIGIRLENRDENSVLRLCFIWITMMCSSAYPNRYQFSLALAFKSFYWSSLFKSIVFNPQQGCIVEVENKLTHKATIMEPKNEVLSWFLTHPSLRMLGIYHDPPYIHPTGILVTNQLSPLVI